AFIQRGATVYRVTSESTVYGGRIGFSENADVFTRIRAAAATAAPAVTHLHPGNSCQDRLGAFVMTPARTCSRKAASGSGVYQVFRRLSSSVSFMVLAPRSARMRPTFLSDLRVHVAIATSLHRFRFRGCLLFLRVTAAHSAQGSALLFDFPEAS